MTNAVQRPTEPSGTRDAIPTLSPMVIRPATFQDTLRTLFMVLAISVISVSAAVIAWRWFLASPLPDDTLRVDAIGALPAQRARPAPRIELEVSVRKLRADPPQAAPAVSSSGSTASTTEPDAFRDALSR